MTQTLAEAALHAFLLSTMALVRDSGEPITAFRGIAFFDTTKDAIFTRLGTFEAARGERGNVPLVAERYGLESVDRLTLQFAYEALDRMQEPTLSDDAFRALWNDFERELQEPMWVHRGVANLRNLRTDAAVIDLGRGVTLRRYDEDDLQRLGIGRWALQDLRRETQAPVHDFRYRQHVLVVEDRTPKSPDELIMGHSDLSVTKALRALTALRLLAPGDIQVGALWFVRPASFNVGVGGGVAKGPIGKLDDHHFGEHYLLTPEIVAAFGPLYDALGVLNESQKRLPGNVALALRAFNDSYERAYPRSDMRILDCITAVEALLGTESEIAFRLSFRVASLLADSGSRRAEIFNEMKSYYDTRSRLVHGGALRDKHREVLRSERPLRGVVRRLLRAFLTLASAELDEYGKKFFKEELDAALLDDGARSALRRAMALG